jgi:hypothetical protein
MTRQGVTAVIVRSSRGACLRRDGFVISDAVRAARGRKLQAVAKGVSREPSRLQCIPHVCSSRRPNRLALSGAGADVLPPQSQGMARHLVHWMTRPARPLPTCQAVEEGLPRAGSSSARRRGAPHPAWESGEGDVVAGCCRLGEARHRQAAPTPAFATIEKEGAPSPVTEFEAEAGTSRRSQRTRDVPRVRPEAGAEADAAAGEAAVIRRSSSSSRRPRPSSCGRAATGAGRGPPKKKKTGEGLGRRRAQTSGRWRRGRREPEPGTRGRGRARGAGAEPVAERRGAVGQPRIHVRRPASEDGTSPRT